MSLLATWIWQGVVLALAVAGLLRFWRPGAATRTFVWWAALLAVLSLPLPSLAPQSLASGVLDVRAGATVTGLAVPVPHDAFISVAIGIWLGSVLLGLVTLAHGFVKLRRVKTRCSPLGVAREQRLRGWTAARDGRWARVCLSDDVAIASALGLGAPVIAVNTSLAQALDDRELDQLVLHEYAHLARFDDWTQLLQALVETFCGLHPAIWWIGRALRFERESAADEWVVRRTGSPHEYASCLATIADVTLVGGAGGLLHGAGGLGIGAGARRGDLLCRVERILGSADGPPRRLRRMACATTAAALAAGAIGLRQLPELVHIVDIPAQQEAIIRHARLEADLRDWAGTAHLRTEEAAFALEVSSTPLVRDTEGFPSNEPPLARSVPPLRADTATIATNLRSLDTSVMQRHLARADSGGLPLDSAQGSRLLHSSRLEASALVPALSPITRASPPALSAVDEHGDDVGGHSWLGLPAFAKQTSETATKTATSIAKATAENTVDVGGVLADFGKTRATRSVGWLRRRLGLGPKSGL